jgi:hypothetical protein
MFLEQDSRLVRVEIQQPTRSERDGGLWIREEKMSRAK